MKKLITGIVMAVFLTFAVAGQAMAYFENGSFDGKLVQFIYTEVDGKYSDNEVGTDLFTDKELSFPTYDFTGSSIVLDTKDASTFLDHFTTTSDWADLSVGYYSTTYSYMTGESHRYVAMTTPDFFEIGSWSSIAGSSVYLSTKYGAEGTPVVVGPTSHAHSYDHLMNSDSTSPGCYADFSNDYLANVGEANLGALNAGAGSYVDMYLFEAMGESWLDGDFVTDTYRATMRIGIDDVGNLYTTMTPNVVPIPGAVWLLGSGLLGLVGIRRRKSA